MEPGTESGDAAEGGAGALVDFAEDLGALLGTARGKASAWLSQRDSLTKQLLDMRQSIDSVLGQLGTAVAAVSRGAGRAGRGRRKAAAKAGADAGRPRKRRRVSAEARKRMSEAAKRRWAARRGDAS
jgi:hypothetical protein